jgi:hypothetical protein
MLMGFVHKFKSDQQIILYDAAQIEVSVTGFQGRLSQFNNNNNNNNNNNDNFYSAVTWRKAITKALELYNTIHTSMSCQYIQYMQYNTYKFELYCIVLYVLTTQTGMHCIASIVLYCMY